MTNPATPTASLVERGKHAAKNLAAFNHLWPRNPERTLEWELATALETAEREKAKLDGERDAAIKGAMILQYDVEELRRALENLVGANTSIDAGPNELRLAVQSARAALASASGEKAPTP